MSTLTVTQNDIADGIEKINPNFAWLLREGEAILENVESPFVRQHSIISVEITSSSHPVLFFISKGPGDRIDLLTGNPDAFREMIRSEKIQIKEEDAIVYTDLFVETTQERGEPLFALKTFDDIPYPKDPDAEQLQKKHRDRNQFAQRIQPPQVKKTDGSLRVERFYLQGKKLQLWTFTISSDGNIDVQRETLHTDVGIYYWV